MMQKPSIFLLILNVLATFSFPDWYIEYLPDFVYTEEIKYLVYQDLLTKHSPFQRRVHSRKLASLPPLLTSQYDALYDFYVALGGPYWRWNATEPGVAWNFSDPNASPCFDWQGISCDHRATYSYITGLILPRHNLTGPIPASFGDLTTLQMLDLPHNNIKGQFPSTISALTELAILDMGYNELTGKLTPHIGDLSSLILLSLTMNSLTSLPEELYQLPKIQALNFFLNDIVGTISPSISNLSKTLEHLNYGENKINGSIPASITELTKLITLNLGFNILTHTIPNDIGKLSNMSYLIIPSTSLHGTIPVSIANMTHLKSLVLSNGYFVGSLAPEFGNFTEIENFIVESNILSGTIPESYRNFNHIFSFYIEDNQFHGTIDVLGGMKTLVLNQVNDNFFTGNASVFNSLDNLELFYCPDNLFTGSLPVNPNWQQLKDYQFYQNYFSGSIPSGIFNLSKLVYLVGDNNYLTGSFPVFEETLSRISEISINNNTLTGPLPASINRLTGLTQLILVYNFLTGSIPETIGDLDRLVLLYLAYNNLEGTIPSSFTNLEDLEQLFLRQNNFIGNVNQFLNSTKQSRLSNIDISNNQFTGTLSPEFFAQAKRLQSFTASSNCFHGSIPEEICEATSLVSLSLDGLSTATNCRIPLFTALPYFDSFSVRRFLQGSIPACLFNMSLLQVLHLSGNGFTGSLSNDLAIASNLTDLSLSHNLLSGDIPRSVQEKYPWSNLDLSYNKFGGILLTSIASFPADSALTLEVNRLSGKIPSQLTSIRNISILEGNIFTCNLRESDLPQHDANFDTYSCGSDNVNYVLYAWIVAIVVIPVFWLLLLYGKTFPVAKAASNTKDDSNHSLSSQRSSTLLELFTNFQEQKKILFSESDYFRTSHNSGTRSRLTSGRKTIHIKRLFYFLQEIRWTFILLTFYCMIVLLPLYGSLTFYTASYRYEYAWTISGMLLRGEAAGITLYLCLTVFIGLLIFLLRRMIRKMKALPDYHPNEKTTSRLSVISDRWWEVLLVYSFIGLVNLMVMAVSDFSYVYIVVNYGYTVVTIAAFALAVFRLGSNNILLNLAIPLTMKGVEYLRRLCKKENSVLSEPNGALNVDQIILRYSWKDLAFLENIILFNNIIIPTLAIIFVLPDCFYNALFAPESVTSTETYISCNEYYPKLDVSHACDPGTETTDYSPPFIYSYQCSSKIVINYVSVYIMMFIFTGLLAPTFHWLVKIYNDRIGSSIAESFSFKGSEISESRQYPPSADHSNSLSDQQRASKLRLSLPLQIESLFLLESLRPLTQKPRTNPSPILFQKLRLTVKLNSFLAIMISFGALFPPIALIACASIIAVTFFEEFLLSRILSESRRLGYSWYEEQIERECEGVESSLMMTVWSSMFVSCCLFAYIIFDTMGDTEGWTVALPVALLMGITPVLFYLLTKGYDHYFAINNDDPSAIIDDEEEVRRTSIELSFRESAKTSFKSRENNSEVFQFENPLKSKTRNREEKLSET